MKIFITGILGQLGSSLYIECIKQGYEVIGCGRKENNSVPFYRQLDLVNEEETINLIKKEKPDVVIHCAAWTDVNGAELQQNQQRVYNTNVVATRNVTEACKTINCKLIYISTDYVYGTEPGILLSEETPTNPLNYYGKTKLLGENEALKYDKTYVVRVSWLFSKYGQNFAQTIISLGSVKPKVTVITDQIGRPTYAEDLSKLLLEMCATDKYGIYNVSNEGSYISWYDYAKNLLSDKQTEVKGETSEEYYNGIEGANRPLNSCFNTNKLIQNGFKLLPLWTDAVDRFKQGI